MEKATMKDVAKLAGVTQPTVSHVINGTAPVSKAVRGRVLQAINTLGYTPNAIAKSLKTRKTNVVGLIVPDVEVGFYAQIVKTVERSLRKEGIITFLCNTFYDDKLERQYVNTLIEHNVSGIIETYGFSDTSVNEKIIKIGIPLISLDDRIELAGSRIPSIEMNNLIGGKMAAQHLCKIGARKIAFVGEPLLSSALIRRFAGFKEGLFEHGAGFDEALCFIEKNQYDKIEMGYHLGVNIALNKGIDAVFTSSDNLAFGVIRRLKEHKIRIPQDIAIMGYDDVPMSKVISPELTTIAQPNVDMAKKGVEILLQRMNAAGMEADDEPIMLNPSLVVRRSTTAFDSMPF